MGIDDLRAGPALAHYYEREGLRIMPLVSGAKGQPRFAGFGRENPDFAINPSDFRDTDAVAILCGPQPIWGGEEGDWWLMCVDIDGEPPDEAWELREFGQSLPTTLTSKKRKHLWYRVGRHRRAEIAQWVRLIEWSGGGVDLKWAGGYAVERGEWDGPFALERIAELPPELIDRIIALGNDSREPESLVECLGLLARIWARPKDRGGEGGCHSAALALGGILARYGVGAEEAERALIDANFWSRTGTDDRTADVLSSIEAHAAHRNTYGWPQLEQVAAAPPRAVARVKKKIDRFLGRRRAALAPMAPAASPEVDEWRAPRDGDFLWKQGRTANHVEQLIRILAARYARGDSRVYVANEVLVRVVNTKTDVLLGDQLGEILSDGPEQFFRKNEKKEWQPIAPPDKECHLLAKRKVWPGIPKLRGVLTCPFLRADGSICETLGYDSASQWYLAESALQLPAPVPERPTAADVAGALEMLMMPWAEFGWVKPEHALVPLAIVLSLLGRAAIDGNVPLHVIEAPSKGAGKTLAFELAALIATGRLAPKQMWPATEDERQKTLASVALAGRWLINLDNIPRGGVLGGPTLDQVLTSGGTTSFRNLGELRHLEVEWNTVIAATGNNIAFDEDIRRRTILGKVVKRNAGRLIAPDQWKIKRVARWVLANRGTLVWAALVLLRGHAAAGRPRPDGKDGEFPSFESWAEVVAGCLWWATGGVNVLLAAPEDDETESPCPQFDGLLAALAGAFGEEWWDWAAVAEAGKDFASPTALALRIAVSDWTDGKVVLPGAGGGAKERVFNAQSWGIALGAAQRYGDPRPTGTLVRRKIRDAIQWRVVRESK